MKRFIPLVAVSLFLVHVTLAASVVKTKPIGSTNVTSQPVNTQFLPMQHVSGPQHSLPFGNPDDGTMSHGNSAAEPMHRGDSAGRTWWDLQSFNSMPNHIVNFQTGIGTMVGVGRKGLQNNDIGPYIAVNDGSSGFKPVGPGGTKSWTRISSDDRLYSAIAGLTDQSEVVISQAGTPTSSNQLMCYIDSSALEGKWSANPIPGTKNAYIPAVAVTDSNFIHVLYVDLADSSKLYYVMSKNKGATWSAPVVVSTWVAGGAYSISANGPRLAMVYNRLGTIGSIISTDNGNNFTINNLLSYRGGFTSWKKQTAGHDTTALYVTNDTLDFGNHLDALIDETGTVHVVAHPAWVHLDSVVIAGAFAGYHLRLSNLISVSADRSKMPDNFNGLFYFSVDNTGKPMNQNRMGPVQGDSSGYFTTQEVQQLYALGQEEEYVGWPQLGYNQTSHTLYCIYGSYDKNDFEVLTQGSNQVNLMFSHLYGTTTTIPSSGWTNPSKITADGVDAQYPSLADNVDANVAITYQADYHAGNFMPYVLAGQQPLFTPAACALVGLSSPSSMMTAVGDFNTASPQGFALAQNYPNPFNPSTRVAFSLDKTSDVRLDVFDMLGRRVATLVNGKQDAGVHTAVFDARSLASGVYTYTITTGTNHTSRTMVMTK